MRTGEGRLELTRDVLLAWAGLVSEGMLPNRFADAGEAPEHNAVDASLWYVVVAGELIERAAGLLSKQERDRITRAVLAIWLATCMARATASASTTMA